VTGGNRRDDEDLPVFDALEPDRVTTSAARRAPRGGGLGPARGAGIAAAALVLLVGAIALGGLSLAPEPTASPIGSDDFLLVTPSPPPTHGPTPNLAPTLAPFPTPFISPVVPCGTSAPTPDIDVFLVVGSAVPVPGAPDERADPPEVHASLGDPIRIMIGGEVCAVDWDIELVVAETGDPRKVDRFDNLNDDPTYAAQNRWDVSTFGQQILTADLHFPGGIDVIRSWRVIVDPFVVPPLYLVGPNGNRFLASHGCGLYLNLANGYEAGENCSSIGYAPGPEALVVRAYRAIHIDLPGWQIINWNAACGRVTTVDTSQFDSPDGCRLGGGSPDDGGPLVDPPAFLLPPGDTVVQLGISAIDGAGNQFSVTYYAHVIAR